MQVPRQSLPQNEGAAAAGQTGLPRKQLAMMRTSKSSFSPPK